MNYESTIKSLLLAASCLSFNYGLTSPVPHRTKGASYVYRGQHFETMVFVWALFGRINAFVVTASHIAMLFALSRPNAEASPFILDAICPHPSSNLSRLQSLNTLFLIGTIGMILGGMLRAWCYATLGHLFTYLVTISPNHKLVTSGPYAYVRHPSYTGIFLLLASVILTHLASPDNYITECGIMKLTLWKWFIGYWVLVCGFSFISLRKRGEIEDMLMKKTFGEEWVSYSKAVPYAFIPFIM